MIKQLIEYLLNIANKHKAVNYVAYKRYQDINDQHNNNYYQFIIEDETMLEKQIVEGILTLRLDIDVLGFINKDNNNLTVQDNALHILLDWMEYITNDDKQIEVHDYSIVSFSQFTGDNASGVRCSLQLSIPSPINICTYHDNFADKPTPIIPELDIKDKDECTNSHHLTDDNEITLSPIKLF